MEAADEDRALFPDDLRRSAVVLGGEYAWPREAALAALEFLKRAGVAVVGVEAWKQEEERPRVLVVSEYEIPLAGDWDAYVASNARAALAELQRTGLPRDVLFNLTWLTEVQATRGRRR